MEETVKVKEVFMKVFLLGMIALASSTAWANSNERTVIHHPTCKVMVQEAVNYRGSGEYTALHGPLKGYAQLFQSDLVANLGYVGGLSSGDAIVITLRTSYADFYVHHHDGFSMKKKTSFCYVDAQSAAFDDIGFYQETQNCKKSLKAVLEQMPRCEVINN